MLVAHDSDLTALPRAPRRKDWKTGAVVVLTLGVAMAAVIMVPVGNPVPTPQGGLLGEFGVTGFRPMWQAPYIPPEYEYDVQGRLISVSAADNVIWSLVCGEVGLILVVGALAALVMHRWQRLVARRAMYSAPCQAL